MGYPALLGILIFNAVSMSFYLYVSLSLLSISPKPNLTLNMPCLLTRRPTLFSLTPPSLFPDEKFPVAEALFWLDKLFYYIDSEKVVVQSQKNPQQKKETVAEI